MLEQQDKKANFIAFSSYGEFLFKESIVKPHCPSKKKKKKNYVHREEPGPRGGCKTEFSNIFFFVFIAICGAKRGESTPCGWQLAQVIPPPPKKKSYARMMGALV
jgi:hypothetical protein